MSQLYSISLYICWELKRKPVLSKFSEKTRALFKKELLPKLPMFGKLNPDIGNECIAKLRKTLEDFHFEDQCIKAHIVVNYPDNFAIEDRKKFCVGQYRLKFSIYNKDKETAEENYKFVLPILLKEMKKLVVETDKAVIKVTGFRTHGEVKNDPELWPSGASTDF